MKILELFEKYGVSADYDSAESITNDIIEECMMAFLINYEGKINPMDLKEMLDEQLGINKFYFDRNANE
jgi:hypothetical protein